MVAKPQEHRKVLLTGGSGFIGNHILSHLLNHGCAVRATVRSQTKADALRQTFRTLGKSLDVAVIPDMTTPGAFSNAFESLDPITEVIHTASPFLYRDVHNNSDLLDPAIQGTKEILQAASSMPGVRRVVITGSIAAVIDYTKCNQGDGNPRTYFDGDWNPITWEEAVSTQDKPTIYRASKTFAERAAWEFMRGRKPCFDLVVLLPPMVYGPPLHMIRSISDLNESNLRIWKLFMDSRKDAAMPPNGVHYFIDARDLAVAHLQALLMPNAGGKRLIVSCGTITSQQIADILRANFPQLEDRTPIGKPGTNTLGETTYQIDGSTAVDILGIGFHDVRSTFVDLGQYLLGIESSSMP